MKDGSGILAGGGTIGSGKASLEDASGVVAGGGGEGADDAGGDGGGDGVTEGGVDGVQDDLATAPAATVAASTVTSADDATLVAAVAAVLPKRSTPRAGGDTDGLSIQRRTTPPDPGDSGTRAVPSTWLVELSRSISVTHLPRHHGARSGQRGAGWGRPKGQHGRGRSCFNEEPRVVAHSSSARPMRIAWLTRS